MFLKWTIPNDIYCHKYCRIKIVNKYNIEVVLKKVFILDIAILIESKIKEYENVIFFDSEKRMESYLFEHNGPCLISNFCGKIYNSTKFNINCYNWPEFYADLK